MKKLILLFFGSLLLVSCSADNMNDTESELVNQPLTATFLASDLVGTWNLLVMKTDVGVDLNNDNVKNTNLKDETTCFDPMKITFNGDTTFSSVNTRMDFAADGDNPFKCMSERIDTGTWSLEGNTLILEGVINGMAYKHEKPLIFKDNTFAFDIYESESLNYVKDPGGTLISDVTIVSLQYQKI